jgi:ribosome biogenesis protein BMS1
MSDVGGMLYDKDAVYIDIPAWKVQYSTPAGPIAGGAAQPPPSTAAGSPSDEELGGPATQGEAMVRGLQVGAGLAVDEALASRSIRLFQVSPMPPLTIG